MEDHALGAHHEHVVGGAALDSPVVGFRDAFDPRPAQAAVTALVNGAVAVVVNAVTHLESTAAPAVITPSAAVITPSAAVITPSAAAIASSSAITSIGRLAGMNRTTRQRRNEHGAHQR